MEDGKRLSPVALCIERLERALPGIKASSEMPPDRNLAFPYVQVSRTGGADGEFMDRPILTFMCWGASDVEAYMLAEDCSMAMRDAALDDDYLSASETISLARDEWAGDGRARYALQLRLTINKP